MINSTIYRKNLGEKVANKQKDSLKEALLKTLLVSDQPLSTQDLSLKLEKPWHSVQTRCLNLQIEGLVNGFKIGRINLWQIK